MACVLQTIGITGYTFITPFWIHGIFFVLTINLGFSLSLPTLLQIATPSVPPNLRGKATGVIAGAMSVGFSLCPLVSGPLFQSNILRLNHDYGSFSHIMWLIGGFVGVIELVILGIFIGFGKGLNFRDNGNKQEDKGKYDGNDDEVTVTKTVEMAKTNTTETV